MKNRTVLKISIGAACFVCVAVLAVTACFLNFTAWAAGSVSAASFYTSQTNSASVAVKDAQPGEELAVFSQKAVGENTQYNYVKNYAIAEGKAVIDQLSFSQNGDKQEMFVAVVDTSDDLSAYDGKFGTSQNAAGEETVTLPDGDGHSMTLKKITVIYDTTKPVISGAALTQAVDRENNIWVKSSDRVTVKFKLSDTGSGVDNATIQVTLGGKNPVGAVTYDAQKAEYSAEFNVSDFTTSKVNGDTLFDKTALRIDASDCAGNAADSLNSTLSSDLKYDNLNVDVSSFASDNSQNTKFAIVGNTLTLQFQTNIAVDSSNVTVLIAGQSLQTLTSKNDDKMNWTATYPIPDSNSLSNGAAIPFSITVTDQGNKKTAANDSGTNVTYSTPIDVQNLSFASSGSASGAAAAGDALTLTFDTQRAVNISIITIAGHSVTPLSSNGGLHWVAEYTLTDKETLSDGDTIPYTFTAEDDFGNTVTKTQADTDAVTYFTVPDPVKSNFSVTCSSGTSIAKKGDTITVSFTKRTYSRFCSVNIAGISVNAASTNFTDWTASYTLGTKKGEVLSDNGKITCSAFLYGKPLQDQTITYYAPINITQLSLKSGNSNTTLAKNGDTVTVGFQTDHPVTLTDTTIAGQAVTFASSENDGMQWTGSYTISGSEVSDNHTLPFTVTASDAAGNTAVTKTDADLSKQVTYYAPIQAGNLKIASGNVKPLLAKDSDTVTVTFQTTHPVSVPSGSIAGKVKTDGVQFTSADSMAWKGTYTLKNGDVADLANIPFSFTLADNAGNGEVSNSQSDLAANQQVQYYAPIDITGLTFGSGETNPRFARNGSTLTLSFATQHEAAITDISIAGKTVTPQSSDKKNWSAVCTLDPNDIKAINAKDNSNIPFSFAVSDVTGNTAHKSEKNTAYVTYYAPIAVNGLSYSSDNKQTGYAKDGNTVSIHFTTTHPVLLSNQTVAGQPVSFASTNDDGMNWTANYTVLNGKTKDNTDIPFTFTVKDNSGNDAVSKTNSDVSDSKAVRYYAPIGQSILNYKFSSNNKQSGIAYAKNGDTVTLSFQTTHPVSLSQTQIAGQPATFTDTNSTHMNWSASFTVENGKLPDNTDVPYTLSINDIAQNQEVTRTQSGDAGKIRYQAPIVIHNLTFESDNSKTPKAAARNGNVVTSKFSTTHPVILSNTKIAGQTVAFSSANNDGMDWTATYTVVNGQTADNANIALSLTANDASGNAAVTKTEQDTSPVKYYEPIRVSGLKILTDNANDGNKYAKDGNQVTVTWETNHSMSLSDVSVANRTNAKIAETKLSGCACRYTLSYTLHGGDVADLANVGFRFRLDDAAGNSTVTKSDTDADVTNRIQYFSPITAKTAIASNGRDTTFAKNGDTISLKIETNHNTKVVSSAILDRAASASGNNSKNLVVSYAVSTGETALKEGNVTFTLSVTDLAGNVLPIHAVTDSSKVTYDRTAPVVSLAPDFSGFTNKKISYSVIFSDTNLGGQGLSFTVNGNEQLTQADRNAAMSGTSFTKSITLDAEGEYNIAASARDRADNSAKSDITAKVTIDKTAPKITSTKIDLGKTLAFQKGFSISKYFNIDDKYEKDIICKVTDSTGSVDWDINTPITTDGKKTIYLLVTDMAGNTSRALTYDLYIDGTAPKVQVKDTVTNKELAAGKNSDPFIGKETLRISLDKLNIGSEAEDKFIKLEIVNQKGELVYDLLKDGKKENGAYVLDLKDFGDYKLLAQAEDDVGNKTEVLEYPFVFQDQSVLSKYYENKPLFYSTLPAAAVLILAAGVLLVLKISKKRKSPKA